MTIQNTLLSNRNPALLISSKKSFGDNQLQPLGTFSGILFDMDGTLIHSTNAIVKFWTRYVPPCHVPRPPFTSETDKPPSSIGERYKIDPKTILATSHGRRSIDVFAEIDQANATWDCKSLPPISLF
jgi:hypothetical protein